MGAETKGQARADHGPGQKHVRVNLREKPGSPGTRLKSISSTKQKFIYETCKKNGYLLEKNILLKQQMNESQTRETYGQNTKASPTKKSKKASRMKLKRTKQSKAELERIETHDYLNSPLGSEVAEAGPRVKSSGLNGETVPGSIRLAIPASQVLQTVNVSKKNYSMSQKELTRR